MSKLLCLFSTIFFLSFGLTHLWADEGFRFKRQNLKVNGEIIEKMYVDLDSDSLIDVLVFYLEGEDENFKRMIGLAKRNCSSWRKMAFIIILWMGGYSTRTPFCYFQLRTSCHRQRKIS